MATQQAVIKNLMASLDNTTLKGSAALDAAIKANTKFKSTQAVINQMIADQKKAGSADEFLQKYCGINLSNRDTGAITGSDAGGTTVKTAKSIVPESDSPDENFKENSFTVNGLTVKLGQDKGTATVSRSFNSLSQQEKYIWQSLKSYWIKSGLNLIVESYGNNFSFSKEKSSVGTDKPATKTLYIVFDQTKKYSGLTYYADDWDKFGAQKPTEGISIGISLHYFGEATGKDGEADNGIYSLDRLVAHELTHAVMKANVDYFDYLPAFIKEGMAELTIGIDDENSKGIKAMAGNPSYLQQALSLTDYSTISISGVQGPTYAAGYMFLRYLAKQASTRGNTLSNSAASTSVVGGANEDTLTNYADNVTLSGGSSNDSIVNYGGSNVKILSDNGADQIYSYGAKTSINPGAGDDFVCLYANASNVTVAATSGNNEIHSAASTAKITTGSGNDYVMLFTNAKKNTVKSAGGNDKIYSGAQTASISAGAGDDYIHLYSDATKNTVYAGTGNDSIVSYATKGVLFNYASGDGNDVITGVTKADTVSISGAEYSSVASGKDLILSVGTDSVTLTGAKNIAFTVKGSLKANNPKSITGTAGNDSINNSISGATIQALGGNDRIYNTGTKTKIYAGAGIDSVFNHAASVTIDAGDGADYLSNFQSGVSIVGGAGKDSLYNSSVASGVTLDGGADNDYFSNQGNKALIRGGTGNDTVRNYANNVSISGGDGADSIVNWGSDVSIVSGNGNDTLYGDAGNDTLYGGADNDKLWGYDGDDYLVGDDGNDYIVSGAGKDSVWGGAGTDSIWGDDGDDYLVGNDGNDYIVSGAGKDSVWGGAGTDSIWGDDGDDYLVGNDGNDYIVSGAGKDSVWGGTGKDSIYGNAGNDKLYGDAGNDVLLGGAGNDSLWGGDGADKFFYYSGEGKDVIFGFEDADLLQISGTFTGTYNKSAKTIAFKVGSTASAITLKEFTATTFHVNGDTYRISGTKLVK